MNAFVAVRAQNQLFSAYFFQMLKNMFFFLVYSVSSVTQSNIIFVFF